MLLLVVLVMAEEKMKVLSLLIAFLSAINAILLAYSAMPGGNVVSYLYLFSLDAEQTDLFLRISVLVSLVSFTTFAYLSYYPRD